MKRFLCFALVLVSIFMLASCSPAKMRYSKNYYDYFDTFSTLTVYGIDEDTANEIFEFTEEELKKYHQLLDIYNTYPDVVNLKTINDNAGKNAVLVSAELMDMLSYSVELSREYGDYFNIAMGSVLKIWHEHRENALLSPDSASLPDGYRLRTASEHTDINNVILESLSSDCFRVFLNDEQMSLDVGAVAKGYVARNIANSIKKKGCDNFVLNIGGNIVTSGHKEKGQPWQVAIEDPRNTQENICTLKLNDMSLVTSGSYQRYFVLDGVNYHHIIDPRTLMPKNEYLSVSVLHSDPAFADAMSTTLFNMPYEIGSRLVENTDGLEAMWVFPDGVSEYSENFNDYILK